MYIFLIVTLTIAIFNFFLLYLNSIRARERFKAKYPETMIKRSHWSETTAAGIKFLVISICPVLNVLLAYVFLFKDEELCNQTVEKLYKRCMEEAQ